MSNEIRAVDPETVAQTDPVDGLSERPLLRDDGCRLVVIQITAQSAWHSRDGAVYGWVRSGSGQIEYGAAAGRESADLHAGDFVRVPDGVVHRFTATADELELLAVVAGDATVTAAASPIEGDAAASDPAESGVAVVGPDDLVETVASSDLIRETPFPDDDVLVMRVRAEGGAAAGWHHHADNAYFGYAVDGPSETEYVAAGDGEKTAARIDLGECFQVPARLIHRDTNPTDEAHMGIIWLVGGPPWVVNVDAPDGSA